MVTYRCRRTGTHSPGVVGVGLGVESSRRRASARMARRVTVAGSCPVPGRHAAAVAGDVANPGKKPLQLAWQL
jgi:hypothetical protein